MAPDQTDPVEAAYHQAELTARSELDRLTSHLVGPASDGQHVDADVIAEEISAAIASLEKLERYRTPRLRAWLKTL